MTSSHSQNDWQPDVLWVVVGAIIFTIVTCVSFLIYCFVTAPLCDEDGTCFK